MRSVPAKGKGAAVAPEPMIAGKKAKVRAEDSAVRSATPASLPFEEPLKGAPAATRQIDVPPATSSPLSDFQAGLPMSPKDIVICAGKRKRERELLAGVPLMSVDFMRSGTLFDDFEISRLTPSEPAPPATAQESPIARALCSTIADHLASGQMKVDPLTRRCVPNDIFVRAIGADGVLPAAVPVKKHSKYRGVTKHRRSGRWESHIWIKETGKQMYLGAYEQEEHAAEAYDVAALKIKGDRAKLNFEKSKYGQYLELLDTLTLAELVKTVKSRVPPAQRLSSNYRGVFYSNRHQMWEAKYQTQDKKQTRSLGLHETEEGAARAFDRAMVAAHGNLCTINFNHSDYERELLTFHEAQLRKLEDGRGK